MDDVRTMHVIDNHQHLIGQNHYDEFIQITERFFFVFIAYIYKRTVWTIFRSKYTRIAANESEINDQETRELQ